MIKRINLPSLLLISYLIRLLITGASAGDAIIMVGFSALYGFYSFLEQKKESPVNQAYIDRLNTLEEQHKFVKDKVSSMSFGGLKK